MSLRRHAANGHLIAGINNKPLAQTDTTKFHNVIIYQNLTWNDHIASISKKFSKNIGIISWIKHCLPNQILRRLYYTWIYPSLFYCNIVWGSKFKSNLRHLFILQKRIIRIICSLPWCASTSFSFHDLHILTLNNNKITLLFMCNCHHSLLLKLIYTRPTIYLGIWISSQIHSHNTRSSHHYRSQFARVKIEELSILRIGPPLWNKPPDDLKRLINN